MRATCSDPVGLIRREFARYNPARDLDASGIDVRPKGRLLIRNICMVFDAYLAAKEGPVGFSKVI